MVTVSKNQSGRRNVDVSIWGWHTRRGCKLTPRQQLSVSWLVSGEALGSLAGVIFACIFAGHRAGHVPGTTGPRLPAATAASRALRTATPPHLADGQPGQAEGRGRLLLLRPGAPAWGPARPLPASRTADSSSRPAPPRGVIPAGPRRAPPAAPRPPLALQRPAAAGLTDLLGCRHRRSSRRRCRRRRRCRHLPALATTAAAATALPAAAVPRAPALAPWRGGRGAQPLTALPHLQPRPAPAGRFRARGGRGGPAPRRWLPGAFSHAPDCSRPRAASGFLRKGALKIRKTPLPLPSLPHHEGLVPSRVLLAARAGISLERREYAWTRKEVVIMWQKLTSCRLGSENLENRDPLRGHTITSGMLLSSGGPVKSDAFFL